MHLRSDIYWASIAVGAVALLFVGVTLLYELSKPAGKRFANKGVTGALIALVVLLFALGALLFVAGEPTRPRAMHKKNGAPMCDSMNQYAQGRAQGYVAGGVDPESMAMIEGRQMYNLAALRRESGASAVPQVQGSLKGPGTSGYVGSPMNPYPPSSGRMYKSNQTYPEGPGSDFAGSNGSPRGTKIGNSSAATGEVILADGLRAAAGMQ